MFGVGDETVGEGIAVTITVCSIITVCRIGMVLVSIMIIGARVGTIGGKKNCGQYPMQM